MSTSLGAESHELTIFSVLSYRPLPQLPGPHPPSRRGAQNGSEFLYKEESTASRKCASRCGRGARGARRLSSALNSTCTYVDIRKDAFSILLLYHFHKPVSPRPFACHRRFSLSLTFFRPGQGGAPSSGGVGCATASSSGRTGTAADHGELRAMLAILALGGGAGGGDAGRARRRVGWWSRGLTSPRRATSSFGAWRRGRCSVLV